MLYQGIAFSPQTALTQNINATETIIRVADVTVFPDAPNYATIGTDEDGETIMYAAKADGMLSGCTRGVEGTAKPWNAGEVIARNFTAKDQSDMIDELAKKQNKLTGTASQVVGFGSDGNATAVERWSNRNLLDNWYFVNPINQRGKTEYTGITYTIDRWKTNNASDTVTLHDGHVNVSLASTSKWFQPLEQPINIPHALSFLFGSDSAGIAQIGNSVFNITGGGLFSVVVSNGSSVGFWAFSGNLSADVIAAKLELGSVQTLAHKEGDIWVLNDPLPNPALELAKCQRYYVKIAPGTIEGSSSMPLGIAHIGETEYVNFQVVLPVTMRANPSMKYHNLVLIDMTANTRTNLPDDGIVTITDCSAGNVHVNIRFEGWNLDNTHIYRIFVNAGGFLEFSSDL